MTSKAGLTQPHAQNSEQGLIKNLDRAAEVVRTKLSWPNSLDTAVVLGSGLGDFVNTLSNTQSIGYEAIPGFPQSTVSGHQGRLVLGKVAKDHWVLVMQGRSHFYEGYPLDEVTFGVRLMHKLGIKNIAFTNAAGALNTSFRPGDIMMITDHINFMGVNPLRGPNREDFGPRFPDMTDTYTPAFQSLMRESAQRRGIELREGIYFAVTGPCYETPAEIRAFQKLGADAVGMSTVPEVIVARHCGMQIAGISCMTNMGAGLSKSKLHHEEVVSTAKLAVKNIFDLLTDFCTGTKDKK
jgi:purine-nucleoside phosphorylase